MLIKERLAGKKSSVVPVSQAQPFAAEPVGCLPRPLLSGLFPDAVDICSALDVIPLPMAFLSTQKKVLFLNQAALLLTGFSEEEVYHRPCMYVFRSRTCGAKCPITGTGEEELRKSFLTDIITAERRKIPVRVTLSPVQNAQGELAGYIETLEDVRLLHELEHKQGWNEKIGDMLGHSHGMERIFTMMSGIAQTDSSVLITGETGTGKDLLAEAIHNASSRAKGPFVKVNCGALPDQLLESELFGHCKGAFTGATENKPGRFRMAQGGTLFLTEIGDLPLALQVKLLTFLDDKVIHPLGSTKSINVDVRIIAATHRDLRQMVREGKFREDLLYRLNVVRFHMPPLRERGDDVQLFLNHFVHLFSEEFHKKVTGFSHDALFFLEHYSFPGNVRELRNIVEYCVNVCRNERIEIEHLPHYLMESGRTDDVQNMGGAAAPKVSEPQDVGANLAVKSGNANWAELERRMILDALLTYHGRKSKAAEALGWSRSTLWRKMKEHGVDA